MDWDDARFFLAVSRQGSLAGAARTLGCSHSTVRRRLEGLEEALGVALFVASSTGLVPTDASRDALVAAERLEQAALAFSRELSGRSDELRGRVVVTAVDGLAPWLAPATRAFARAHSDVELELLFVDRPLDLSRREADIAVRATNAPDERLFGRRVARFEFAPFAAQTLVGDCPPELTDLPWILYRESAGATLSERWHREQVGRDGQVVRVSGGGPMMELVRAGVGAALLPTGVARDERLVALGPPVEGLGVDVWCLTHDDLRESARIRAFMDAVAQHAAWFEDAAAHPS